MKLTKPMMFVKVGESLTYDVSATDPSGVATYAINDSVNFAIDTNGALTNAIVLGVRVYYLRITVTDSFGNDLLIYLKITVEAVSSDTDTRDEPDEEEPTDDGIPGFPLEFFIVLSGLGIACILVKSR
jgi:hypothetical protein